MGSFIFHIFVCVLAYFCPPLALLLLLIVDKYA